MDPDVEPVGVERTVSVPTGALALTGRVDRIDDAGDELVVVDYKTGRAQLTDDDARCSQALALYVLATRRTLRRPCRRVELHHIPTGQVLGYQHTDESLARHLARAEATAHDIRAAIDTLASGAHVDEAFPPAPSPACSWCDFRQHCPEGACRLAPAGPLGGAGRRRTVAGLRTRAGRPAPWPRGTAGPRGSAPAAAAPNAAAPAYRRP